MSSSQAQVLVQIVVVEPGDGRLENVRRRYSPEWITPTIERGIPVKRGLGLRTGEAELAGARQMPGRGVAAQSLQALGDLFIGERNDPTLMFEEGADPVATSELDRTGAVFSDMTEKGERITRGNLKFAGATVRHGGRPGCPGIRPGRARERVLGRSRSSG